MKHFKDTKGDVFGIESDGSQDFLIQPDWVSCEQPAPTPVDPIVAAKAERDHGQFNPIEVGGRVFDAHETAQRNIEGAIRKFTLLDSMLRGDGTLDWTLANDQVVLVTKADLIAAEDAIALRYASLHAQYTALKKAS